MNALRELIEAGEQAGRNEVVSALRETGFYTEEYLGKLSDTRGEESLAKVIKIAAEEARENALADAIGRFSPVVSDAVSKVRDIRDENADLRQQLTELRDENASLRQDVTTLTWANDSLLHTSTFVSTFSKWDANQFVRP